MTAKDIEEIARFIANKIHMPYCWQNIYERLQAGAPLPFKLDETPIEVPEFKEEKKELKYSANDIDGAYLIGVFNSSGIDGLDKELKRLKELGILPHRIFEIVKTIPTNQ